MHDESDLTPAEQELELALSRLRPARSAIDRDQIMFSAGANSVRRSNRSWQTATGLLAVMLVVTVLRPLPVSQPTEVLSTAAGPIEEAPRTTEDVQALASRPDASFSPTTTRWTSSSQYLHLRNQVVALGADGLPPVRGFRDPALADHGSAETIRAFPANRMTGG